MGDKDQPNNPFAALFSAPSQPPTPVAPTAAAVSAVKPEGIPNTLPSNEPLDRIARDVFYFTCQKTSGAQPAVFLEDVASSLGSDGKLDMTLFGEALFERLLLPDPEKHVFPMGGRVPSDVIEEKVLSYLYECWRRLQGCTFSSALLHDVGTLILRNTGTSLIQPDLYPNQNLAQQLLQVLMEEDISETLPFMVELVKHLMAEDGTEAVESALRPTLDQFSESVAKASLLALNHGLLRAALVLARCGAPSAGLLLKHSAPRDLAKGRTWGDTLLGRFLNLSCLPGSNEGDSTIFNDVVAQPSVMPARESSIHTAMSAISSGMHSIFEAILKSSAENRRSALDWMWGCLEANNKRGSLWSAYSGLDREVTGLLTVSDGFALNLEAVALKLCAPFCRPPPNSESEFAVHPKLMSVDPSFCAVEVGTFAKGGLHKQTCLLPSANEDASEGAAKEAKRPHSESFTFITEVFFLAQRATDLGSRVAQERLTMLNQETARVERLLHQIGASSSEAAEQVRRAMERTAGQFLAYRVALTEASLVENSARLHAATANWLVQLLLDNTSEFETRTSFAPGTWREIHFPLAGEEDGSTGPARVMELIPELVVENFASFLVIARKFHSTTLEQPWLLWPSLTLVVALMGSPGRVRNPHVRARLAEVLEAMLPWQRGEEEWLMERQQMLAPASRFQRERVFKEHPHRLQVAESLVRVFVDIEVTGQSVTFEQKFSYRHPMYMVLEHLWKMPEHRECFSQLAQSAEENIESVSPPVFLRFANLLINDAVFLLDEALAQMAALREKQTEREDGTWHSLPARERDQNERNLEHMGGLARSYNVLGRETIHTLEMLTSEIHSLFCHPTMVDRVAAMLNYFLLQLVGPKSKSLKVHNSKEYEFDPGRVVTDICRIYVHLGGSSDFCAAVSRDGRSYNAELFPRAESVLARIGGAALLPELRAVAGGVAAHAERQSCEDELLAEAPEEFLDPITATLMSDPVTLPSSQVAIDRSTIARHLLSDQMDPFNRSPLTMDQLLPNPELKERIQQWIAERRAASAGSKKPQE